MPLGEGVISVTVQGAPEDELDELDDVAPPLEDELDVVPPDEDELEVAPPDDELELLDVSSDEEELLQPANRPAAIKTA